MRCGSNPCAHPRNHRRDIWKHAGLPQIYEGRSGASDLTYAPATRLGSISYPFCQNDDTGARLMMSEQIWPPKQRVAKKAPRTCRKRGASPLSNRKSQSTVRLSKRSRRLVRPPRHMIVVNRVFSPRQYNFVIGPIPVLYARVADCCLQPSCPIGSS